MDSPFAVYKTSMHNERVNEQRQIQANQKGTTIYHQVRLESSTKK